MNSSPAAMATKHETIVKHTSVVSFLLDSIYALLHGLSATLLLLVPWTRQLADKQLNKQALTLKAPARRLHVLHSSPSRTLSTQKKLTVVLDLDETLVLTCMRSRIPQNLEMSAKLGKLESLSLDCDLGTGQPQKLIVFLRPGLTKFLRQVVSFSEVILYSAAVRSYARPLVDALDPHGQFFSKSLFRESTVRTNVYKYVKDLSKLGSDLRRTVLVDNRAFSFLLQPHNGIKCPPFRGNYQDKELHEVVLPILESLSFLKDVRPTLNTMLRMESWFKSKGILL